MDADDIHNCKQNDHTCPDGRHLHACQHGKENDRQQWEHSDKINCRQHLSKLGHCNVLDSPFIEHSLRLNYEEINLLRENEQVLSFIH